MLEKLKVLKLILKLVGEGEGEGEVFELDFCLGFLFLELFFLFV